MARRKKSAPDDLNKVLVALPWWVGPILVVVVYGLLRYAAPPLLEAVMPKGSDSGTATMNRTLLQVIGPLPARLAPWVAGLVLVLWVVSLVQKWSRREMLSSTRELEDLRSLSWQDFELFVGQYYRRCGYMVEERGGASPDGGIDIVLRKNGRRILVQCKHWKASKVGIREARELLGTMQHEGAGEGILVTSGHFSQDACDFAEKNGIQLVDSEALIGMVRSVQESGGRRSTDDSTARPQGAGRTPEASTIPSCPKCGGPMVLRTATRGPSAGSKFYGCQKYPACRGIRNIPGR